ncbi:MAG: hypothetical protein O2930_02515 [Acidobacteria bacterium]|nr:hypothetical protein [Acidobacteriota bacterium]
MLTGGDNNAPPDHPKDDGEQLALARTHALAALQVACAPAHRASLEQTIADLDCRRAVLAASRWALARPALELRDERRNQAIRSSRS